MKQPELGRKITELRNGKGLTQEELVDTFLIKQLNTAWLLEGNVINTIK